MYELEGSTRGDVAGGRASVSVVAGAATSPDSVEGEGDRLVDDGVPVLGSVSIADTTWGRRREVARDRLDASATTAGGGHGEAFAGPATSIWSSTERPKRVPDPVSIVCMTSPVAMSICQMSPDEESAVQNDVPSGRG